MRALRCGTHGGCKAARTAAHNENVGRNLFNALGSSYLGCPLIKVRNLAARGNDGGCNTFENPLAGHRGAAYRINVDAVGLNHSGGNALKRRVGNTHGFGLLHNLHIGNSALFKGDGHCDGAAAAGAGTFKRTVFDGSLSAHRQNHGCGSGRRQHEHPSHFVLLQLF